MTQFSFRTEDLINNPTPRVAVCLCLDNSLSMSGLVEYGAHPDTKGVPIDELNKGVSTFYRSIQGDDYAKYAAEVAVVAFSYASFVVRDFETVTDTEPPHIELEREHGGTSLGAAVETCLNLLEERKRAYSDAGVDYYQPWLVIMTDGRPTDDTHLSAAPKVTKLIDEKKLTLFPIGVGNGADLEILGMFSPKRRPLKLKGLKFEEFFEWLSKSVSRVSQSQLNESINLDMEGLKGWAQL